TTVKVGVNACGGAGCLVTSTDCGSGKVNIVATSPSVDLDHMVSVLSWDSTPSRFRGTGRAEWETCRPWKERDPANTRWGDASAESVMESTGMSPTTEKARACLTAGPRKSSPLTPHPAEAPVFGTGTNREKYNGSLKTASKVSCTTKHVPLYSRSHTTPLEHHGGTRGHSVCRHCPSGKLRRDGRAAAQNVIPAFSGTSKAVAKVIPELNGKLTGMASRVPTANVSAMDRTSRPQKAAKHNDVKKVVRQARESPLEGTLGSTEDQLVSCDSGRRQANATANARAGTALSDHCSWSDGRSDRSYRVVDVMVHMASKE
uniref:Glyceraldehyde-3-phosphate dehydrogenase n=1 Tax=Mustela putorius furo TaxID=9669 RepID=M3YAG9_MUSPF